MHTSRGLHSLVTQSVGMHSPLGRRVLQHAMGIHTLHKQNLQVHRLHNHFHGGISLLTWCRQATWQSGTAAERVFLR